LHGQTTAEDKGIVGIHQTETNAADGLSPARNTKKKENSSEVGARLKRYNPTCGKKNKKTPDFSRNKGTESYIFRIPNWGGGRRSAYMNLISAGIREPAQKVKGEHRTSKLGHDFR